MTLTSIGPGTSIADVKHLGKPSIIAAAILELDDGIAIVDPGPTSTLPGLLQALASGGNDVSSVRAILLTHIHLDHAGATGSLLAENPAIDVELVGFPSEYTALDVANGSQHRHLSADCGVVR